MSNESKNCEILVDEIIFHIRSNTLEQIANNPSTDPWDEGELGAGWLDNEIGFATEFLSRLKQTDRYDWSEFNSVTEFKSRLISIPMDELLFIEYVVVSLGGTNSDQLFNLRSRSNEDIRLYFIG
jgi:hypothetical protein